MSAAAQAVIQVLLNAGFVPDGATRTSTVRVPTAASPVLGRSGGELATFGGRERLARGAVKATVGVRTTAIYRQDGPGLTGVRGIATHPTKDLAAIEATLATLEPAPNGA